MTDARQTVLRFVLSESGNVFDVMSRFRPEGKPVLNRVAWRGKEPRSCGITSVKSRPHPPGTKDAVAYDIEVTYRPKGTITYVGATRYDGWTAMLLDRKKDGTLLDGHGNPLPQGHPPVFLPFEVYPDADFNEINFGEFVGEFPVEGVRHVSHDEVWRQLVESGRFGGSLSATFAAPRRHRPLVKVVLSNSPSGVGVDGFGTRVVNVNNSTPHLERVLIDEITEVVCGFVEGRYSLKTFGNDEFVVAQVDDILVDCTPNEEGKASRFGCLREYVPDTFLDDLAMLLMATYQVDVGVVDGPQGGLLLNRKADRVSD